MRLKGIRNKIELEETNPAVLTVRCGEVRAGWEQYILLTSDRHHDSVDCDRDFERRQLDMAVGLDALVFDFGDLFDVMQGPKDPRASKDKVDKQLATDSYFNATIEQAAPFYKPYADRFLLMGLGNHETKCMKHYGYNPIQALVKEMRTGGGVTRMGWYGGWIRFQFELRQTVRQTIRLKYNHGSGISPIMTFGVLQTRRQASHLPDADIVANGHTHDAYVLPIARERLSEAGQPYQDYQWYVRTPGYKDEHADGRIGFSVEKGGGPKPIGSILGRFFVDSSDARVKCEFVQKLRV